MKRLLIAVAAILLLSGCATDDPVTLSGRYQVEIYNPAKVYGGTTIFGDTSDPANPVIVEVDMAGKVVWSYALPDWMVNTGSPGHAAIDVNWLPEKDTILLGVPYEGIFEVNRAKRIVWSYYRRAVSHDVDRLPNGNTLAAWGMGEDSTDPEAFEIDPSGRMVWEWHAAPHLRGYRRWFPREGYTHTNSVIRLKDGNTLISLRNFFMLVEVNRAGKIVWKLEHLFTTPHDPEELPNGDILVNTRDPEVIREYDRSGRVVWESYPPDALTIRYNHVLPNGNIIFVERRSIVEMTRRGEIVWRLRLEGVGTGRNDAPRWFYKAERIPLRGGAALPPVPAGAKLHAAPDPRGPMTRLRSVAAGMIGRFDSDGDGRVSRSEYHGRRISFAELDLDSDGYATADEIERAIRNRRARGMPGRRR